jgi:hypothetical protein
MAFRKVWPMAHDLHAHGGPGRAGAGRNGTPLAPTPAAPPDIRPPAFPADFGNPAHLRQLLSMRASSSNRTAGPDEGISGGRPLSFRHPNLEGASRSNRRCVSVETRGRSIVPVGIVDAPRSTCRHGNCAAGGMDPGGRRSIGSHERKSILVVLVPRLHRRGRCLLVSGSGTGIVDVAPSRRSSGQPAPRVTHAWNRLHKMARVSRATRRTRPAPGTDAHLCKLPSRKIGLARSPGSVRTE